MNPDPRVCLYKFCRNRSENESRIVARCLNAQSAKRSSFDVSPLGDKVVQLGELLQALLKQAATCLCQYQAMRRAVENAEPEQLLQLFYPFADDRWRGAKFGSGFGEALPLCDPHERIEFVQVLSTAVTGISLSIRGSTAIEIGVRGMGHQVAIATVGLRLARFRLAQQVPESQGLEVGPGSDGASGTTVVPRSWLPMESAECKMTFQSAERGFEVRASSWRNTP